MEKKELKLRREKIRADLDLIVETAKRITAEMLPLRNYGGGAFVSLKPKSRQDVYQSERGISVAYVNSDGTRYETKIKKGKRK